MKHFGYIPTPPEILEQYPDLPTHLRGTDKKLATPFKSVVKFFSPAFSDEPQTTGDCTSHGTRNATDISRAVEIDIKKEPEEWVARGATEPIYGYRGHNGQGMNPGRATEFCVKYGLMLRKNYDFVNLSKYDSSIGIRWGRTGPPAEVKEKASEHPCLHFARVRSVEEAKNALAFGYGLHCGSQYGNDGKRDSRGRARWNASWNHDMAWGGFEETDDLYFLVLNSWGTWNSGGHPEWGPIPGGSFLIPSADASRMISSGECWAIGNVQGWPAQELPDYGSSSFL